MSSRSFVQRRDSREQLTAEGPSNVRNVFSETEIGNLDVTVGS